MFGGEYIQFKFLDECLFVQTADDKKAFAPRSLLHCL